MVILWIAAFLAGVALIVWGAETFAEHLGVASVRLGVSTFAMALLLAGAEPEELATVIAASLKGAPGRARRCDRGQHRYLPRCARRWRDRGAAAFPWGRGALCEPRPADRSRGGMDCLGWPCDPQSGRAADGSICALRRANLDCRAPAPDARRNGGDRGGPPESGEGQAQRREGRPRTRARPCRCRGHGFRRLDSCRGGHPDHWRRGDAN